MAMIEAFAQEIDQEGATTRRVLERVPADRLAWKPHQKSMSLGHLALHVAQTPGFIASWALKDVFEMAGPPPDQEPKSAAQILAAHDESIKTAKDVLQKLGDAGLMKQWEFKAGGKTMMAMPKVALFRAVVLNHWIHHRGQLSVYLRLLDVPVPAIYGPSADENPWAGR
ncbi:MAG: DinB family protein [Vicinamibacterales bacterium]